MTEAIDLRGFLFSQGKSKKPTNNRRYSWAFIMKTALKLVQFQTWADHPVNAAHQHHQPRLKITVQRYLMHTIQ